MILILCFFSVAQYLEEALARHSGKKDDVHVVAFAHYELSSIYIYDQVIMQLYSIAFSV